MGNEEAIEIIKAYKDRLTNSCSNLLDNDIEAFDLAIKALEERPQGEWIEHSDGYITFYTCNRCNGFGYKDDNFCNNCGAKMKGGADNG